MDVTGHEGAEAPFARTVRELIARSGGDAATVRVEALPAGTGAAGRADAAQGKLTLRATDAVSASSVFARYLAEVAGRRITWDAPRIAPALDGWPEGAAAISTPFAIRYHLNVVTHGYSAAFWDWERWERELDWMALHGVTHPLVLTGYETVLAETLRRAGMAAGDAWAWVGGAPHVPWLSMGGMHSFGGPLPAGWADKRTGLARRILARARELGMDPVLPLTGGHVPPEVAGEDAREIEWQGWRTPMLDPASGRYSRLVAAFLDVQRELIGDPGPDPVYALDPYIESLPPTGDAAGLAAAGRGYSEALAAARPGATWLLQGWPFHYHRGFWTTERVRAFLSAVPHEQLLLIDLWGEHAPMWREGMHGRRWIWTAVHNFGGRFALMGDLRGIAADVDELRTALPDRLEGIGLAPEAIENNAVFYELATDLTWGAGSVAEWLDAWAAQRYGVDDPAAREAWRLLGGTLYGPGRTRSIPSPVYARPWSADAPFATQRLAGEALPAAPTRISANVDAENDPRVFADLPDVARAARLIAGLDAPLRDSQERDVVELTGHVLAQGTRHHIRAVLAAFAAGDAGRVRQAAAGLRRDLLDLDALCATRAESRLESWTGAARSWADTEGEADVLERDARSLISVWGHQTSGLHDYSGRHWSGPVRDLHLPRWEAWAQWLADAAERGAEPDVAVLRERIVAIEEAWRASTAVPAREGGDAIGTAVRILDRIAPGDAQERGADR
jgi:alpha-N-acetylglucosaminidase